MSDEGKNRPAGVLLLAHGSPDSPDDVPKFLLKVTGGRELLPEVIEEVKRRYAIIGRSPLTEITQRQRELLEQKIKMPVYVGMRNWRPFISQTLRQMVTDGIHRAIVICMAPQNSRTSVGLYRSSLRACADPEMIFDFVESWHDQPFLIQAFCDKLRASRDKARREVGHALPVIFTAHSVPQRTILEGDPYEMQAKRTAELVAAAASLERSEWRFAFQSQGMSGGPWLGPTVETTILDLARSVGYTWGETNGLHALALAAASRADYVQATGYVEEAERLARATGDTWMLISALADIVNSRLNATREARAL